MSPMNQPILTTEEANITNEVKVIFLGDSELHSPFVISRILNDGMELDMIDVLSDSDPLNELEPRYISVRDWICEQDDRRILVHFWNFSWQDIRSSLYRPFLPARAFYVVVLDADGDDPDNQARHWLHTLHAAAPDAPVLLVLNRAEQAAVEHFDSVTLRRQFQNLTEVVELSALSDSQSQFQETMLHPLKRQLAAAFPQDRIPQAAQALMELLNTHPQEYITWHEYHLMCDSLGIDPDPQLRDQLLAWIGSIGRYFSYSPSGQPEDTWIFRADWILHLLHSLWLNPSKYDNCGTVSHQDILGLDTSILEPFSAHIYQPDEVTFILQLLRQYHLSFEMPQETEFFPMLCAQSAKPVERDYRNNEEVLEFRVEFEYLPDSVLHHLIVTMAGQLDRKNVWYRGARFQIEDNLFFALVTSERNAVVAFVPCNHYFSAEPFLDTFRTHLRNISTALSLRIIDQQIAYQQGGLRQFFSYGTLMMSLEAGERYVYSEVFDRLLPIREILKRSDNLQEVAKEALLQDLAKACLEIRRTTTGQKHTEDSLNSMLCRSLWARGYVVADRKLVDLPSRSGRRSGEVDLLLIDENRNPWTMIEGIKVRGATPGALRNWSDHLDLLLRQYDSISMGLPALFLVIYAHCPKEKYLDAWQTFCEHMRWYIPERTSRPPKFFQNTLLSFDNAQFLRTAQCDYDFPGRTVTVYHFFVGLEEEAPETEQVQHHGRVQRINLPQSETEPFVFLGEDSDAPRIPIPLEDRDKDSRPYFPWEKAPGQWPDPETSHEMIDDTIEIPDDSGTDLIPDPILPVQEEVAQFEYRVVFLGDSEAGKSQLLARVMDPEKGLTEFDGRTTPGICLEHRYYDINDHRVRVNFWDFGGQEILHSLHRMFLSARTLYVIVLNTRNDNHDAQADFWMRYVQAYAYGAPVLFVLNKIDHNPRVKLNLPMLNRQFRKHFTKDDVLRTCAIEPDADKFKAAFTDKLIDRVAEAIDFTSAFTAQQLAIRIGVESCKDTDRVIKTDVFRSICEDNGLENADAQDTLMERFHQAGILVFFGTDLKMLLDPQWITKAIYAVLEKQDELSEGGIVPQKKLEALCRRILGDSDHAKFILEVMRYYGLSFRYKSRNPEDSNSENQEFIPMLCRQEEPEEIDDLTMSDNTMEMQLHFEYLPTGVLYQLMVAFQDQLDTGLVWRAGARFRFGSQVSAIVRRDGNMMRLYVHYDTAGAKSRALDAMEKLRSRIIEVSKQGRSTAKLLDVKIRYMVGTIPEYFDYDRLSRAEQSKVYYVASTVRDNYRLFIRDILTQQDGSEAKLIRKLLEIGLECSSILQGKEIYWFRHQAAASDPSAPKMGEDERTELFWIKLRDYFNVSAQERWGASASGVKSGELDLKIDTREGDFFAILEALNITGDNQTSRENWTEHLERMINHYNSTGLRHLLLVSYLDCAVDAIKDVQTAYLELLRTHRVPNYGVPQINTDVLQNPHERIHVVQADYFGGAGDVSVYHFLVHIPRYIGQPEKKKLAVTKRRSKKDQNRT